MLNLTRRQQIAIGLALTLMMLLTRSHHWASIHSLPDASWAIFFLLGVYVRALWVVPVLIAASVVIDYVAITWGGVSDFCVSPAYWLLIPAYVVLFAGGRFAEPTLAGLIPRLEKYFPPMLGTFALYLGVAATVHVALAAAFRRDDGPRTLMGARREP